MGERSFDGSTDGAGVEHADGRFGAVVDAGEDEVDFAVAKNHPLADLDAVHRSSIRAPVGDAIFLLVLPDMQRFVHRDGMTHGRPRTVRDYHYHLAEGLGDFHHGLQAFGLIAVIIDD